MAGVTFLVTLFKNFLWTNRNICVCEFHAEEVYISMYDLFTAMNYPLNQSQQLSNAQKENRICGIILTLN